MADNPDSENVPSILKWLLPHSDAARKITLLMLLPVTLVYIGRIFINQWLEYNRGVGNLGFLWVIVCPVLCLIGAIVSTFIVGLALMSVGRAHHVAPALILIGGIILVPFLPLPPLPKPVFPEQDFFSAHQAEFEQVVELARQDKLKCPEAGCDYLGRYLPSQYAHLSTTRYADVMSDSQSDLIVRFRPLKFYYPIVYFDVPDDKNPPWNYDCQGRYTRKLDEHRYLCEEDD